ncbi:MAG TPA: ribulose-phosphate 3-epimerase [Candidatus Altiarchaeales archaeon]|nr:ribulose-phosphate 3-epimerase [Candidatus Altiarchaeales archaeon]
MVKIAPSILSADFSKLGEDILKVEEAGVEYLHIDVMDGVFVPNITIGIPVVKSIRKVSKIPFDVHLMVQDPEKYVGDFAKAGADIITIHVEACENVGETLDEIRALGKIPGLSLNPKTPAEKVRPYLKKVGLILVMTVEPGFGGQSFMEEVVPKIAEIRKMIDEGGCDILLEVDGGINADIVKKAADAGADIVVSGSGIYAHPKGVDYAVKELRESA